MKRIFAPFVLFFSLDAAWPRTAERGCGSQPGKRDEIRLLHAAQRGRPRAADRVRPARAAGDIVVMEASGGILDTLNDFDLDAWRLRFEPVGAGYRLRTGAAEPREPAATARSLTLEDDDTVLIDLPFAFPYAGQTWRQVWLNSDGNLTFGRPDTATSPRSLGRFVAGPPRIAPLFMDLDPSRAGRVLVETGAGRAVLTWAGVPEYRSFGIGAPNTFSVTLEADGAIELSLDDTGTFDAVVGLSRGGSDPATRLIDFRQTPDAEIVPATVAERFSQQNAVDIVTVAQRFYQQFDDAYDYLVLYNNLGIAPDAGAVAFESTVRNDRTGYGDRELDDGELYGSRRRLQAFLNLGPLSQYPADPHGIVPARGSFRDTPLSIIGHEAGHLFLALASIRDEDDSTRRPLLGFQSAHWAFNFNSEGSLLEGNKITDLGAGQSPRFETGAPVQGYSPLDQYLMGLRAPADVPPTFLVTNPSINTTFRPAQEGVLFNGTRREVTVDEIIRAEGRRAPDHTLAQRKFRFAFLLLVAPGTEPTAEQLAQVDRYRAEFEPYFARVTGGRGSAETTLRRGVRFSVQPTAGVVAGERANIRLELARPAERELRCRLTAAQPIVDVADAVTLARGASAISFALGGRSSGVTELTAACDDPAFEVAATRVQVAPSRADLRVWVRSGDRQAAVPGRTPEPLLVRATDRNRVPYPGLALRATPRGVSLPDVPLVADAEGELRIAWELSGDSAQRELELAIEGSDAEPVRAVLLGMPVVADGGVVHAASGSPGLSPGALATLYGLNLGAAEPVSTRLPGLSPLGGTQVEIGGRPARLSFVSDRQINLLIPELTEIGVQPVMVRTSRGVSASKPVSIEASWPGIFSARRMSAGQAEIIATGLGQGIPVTAFANGAPVAVLGVTAPVAGLQAVTIQLPQTAGPAGLRLVSRDRSSNTVMLPTI